MDPIDLVRAVLRNDMLAARQWIADAQRAAFDWCTVQAPGPGLYANERVVLAALVDLLARRAGIAPPPWVEGVGPAEAPIFLSAAVAQMPRLRAALEADAPEPLKKRRVFAPREFLTIV